jgi:hypothetical protein
MVANGMCTHPPRSRLALVAIALALLVAGVAAAPADAGHKRVRYTLTVSFDGHQRRVITGSGAGLGLLSSWTARNTGYVARSTRPFWIHRWRAARGPASYSFTTPVKGTLSHTGNGWFAGHPAEPPLFPEPDPPKYYYETWLDPRVDGKAFVAGDGGVSFDVLPKFTVREVLQHWSTGEVSPSAGIWFASGGTTKPVAWGREFGKTFTARYSRSFTSQQGGDFEAMAQHWLLRFVPTKVQDPDVERWQVDVKGSARDTWGYGAGVRAGVDVDWTIRTKLEIEDGDLAAAESRLLIDEVRPWSEPPGGFDVRYRTVKRSPYEPRARKDGDRVTLGLNRGEPSEYRVYYDVRAVGTQVIDALRRFGARDPEGTYQRLATKGVSNIIAGDLVPPGGPVTVDLKTYSFSRETQYFDPNAPCVVNDVPVPDCFLQRAGERIFVTKLR